MPVITIEHLKYKYPNTEQLALNDISLSIEKGEFIGIVGRNGSGKSTLSQAILGLVPQFYKGAYGGKVMVNGIQADTHPTAQMCEHVGLIFQNPFNQLTGAKDTVYGEVAFGLQNLGIERHEMASRVERVLKLLDIWEYKDRNPFDLSGGQMQRVAIASVLVMQPEIIILDEPTSQLDPQGTEEVFRAVDALSESGITIIMIEQKLEKMAHYCDRIILMNDGRMVDFDKPEVIFSRDDLEEMGVLAPAFTRVCRQHDLKNDQGFYPATLEEAVSLLKKANVHVEPEQLTDANVSAPQESTDAIFTVNDMGFYYRKGTTIFDRLNLSLDSRSTAIIGQNGAGKTTLVRLLKGLLKPISGQIYFGSEDIAGKTVAMLADKVGYVFQNPDDQIFKYNVLEEVMFGPRNIGMSDEAAKEKALAALELMGMDGKEDANPYDLDLYDRKMIAIASVVAMDTDVIILDEPTIAQDYPGRKRIGEMIKALSSQGKLVITILHDMDFVAENFRRVIVMAKGQILADGSVEEVFAKDEVLAKARLQKPYMMQLTDMLQ